ncbi:uncharacterized protein LOC119387884 isoform X2 [Rhipicephalus sanguineus]|uniref:uncharacterized protein LOC119387884 isoform X2 n=1 Tax=Rhipicephalus sanguineus TaxID=34632 RepID=UPI001893AE37|nr:uncharacterized protein LOC119387884 isoform X2 [Rhipicephalus sanguineus]XP_049269681.1 uncharacterized protein LOC119387884 isoform X2 [Rhipicephalus sanguineus]
MRTAYGAVLLPVMVGAMAREQFLLLRRRRDATTTKTTQQEGSTEPRNVMHIQEGDVVSFTCAAASHEPMAIEWRHNGSLVQHPPGDERNSSKSSLRVWHAPLSSMSGATLTRSRLRLTNVSANHTGEYTCHFSDTLGTLTRSSHLVVQPKTSTGSEAEDSPCGPDRQCSEKGKACDGKGPCQCPDGSISKEGQCRAVYNGPHFASILAWVSSAAAAAVLLVTLAVLAARRIRRTAGSTLLEGTQDDDGSEEQTVSRRSSFITMTLPASSQLA